MGKLNVNRIAVGVTIFFILFAPVENILRTEQIIYVIGIVVLGLCIADRHKLRIDNSKYILLLMVYSCI